VGGGGARGAGCYLLRWRWANNPLALPSKCPIPADLPIAIADPTYLIAGRDGAPLGERHEALARRSSLAAVPKKNELLQEGVRGVHSKHTLHPLNACMGQDEEIFLAKFLTLFVSKVLRIYLLLQNE
jgi:hypothetical protein